MKTQSYEYLRISVYNLINKIIVETRYGNSKLNFPAQIKSDSSPILPPFMGEMGLEIMGFLPTIEPWLRNGWKIYARRPEFYPPDCAIYDEGLFEKIDKLMVDYHHYPLGNGTIIKGPRVPKNANFNLQGKKCNFLMKYNQEWQETMPTNVQFHRDLNDLLASYVLSPTRPYSFWDREIVAPQDDLIQYCFYGLNSASRALLPSYKPANFVNGGDVYPQHIGVQLRSYHRKINRNSNINLVLNFANQAAQLLGLPILLYGPVNGTHHPDNYQHSYEEAKAHSLPLLAWELRALRTCSLMFSPDSGWADVMAWLQIPSLVEDPIQNFHLLERLNVYQPTMRILDSHQPIKDQILSLLSGPKLVGNLPHSNHILSINKPAGFNNQYFR